MERSDLLTLMTRYDEKQSVQRVVSVHEIEAVSQGENYSSRVSRICVVTERPSGRRFKKWLFSKEMPATPLVREHVEKGGFFVNEITCYRDVLARYEKLLEAVEYTGDIPWPRSFYLEPYSRIVTEDFQHSRFKMVNKFKGLDLEHCILVVQSLSLFHALSLHSSEHFSIPVDGFSENKVYDSDLMANKFYWTLKDLTPVLKSWGGEWDLIGRKIESSLVALKEKYMKCLKADTSRFNVLNHGDSWTNNFLFKYDQYSKKPNRVRMVDFQLVNFNSPARDLVHFLALSPNLEVRRQHVDHLINVYYQALVLNMSLLQVACPRPSLDTIRDEVERFGAFKIFLVVIIAPILIVEGSDLQASGFEQYLEQKKARESRKEHSIPLWREGADNEYMTEILKLTLKEADAYPLFE